MSTLLAARLLPLFLYMVGPGACAQTPPTLAERWQALERRPRQDPARLGEGAALLFEAGELGPALVLAERALAERPADLGLLWRAASISISLSDAQRAGRYADRLWAAVQDQVQGDAEWQEAARRLEQRAEQLRWAEDERTRLLHRARAVSLQGLTAVGVALLVALRVPGRPAQA